MYNLAEPVKHDWKGIWIYHLRDPMWWYLQSTRQDKMRLTGDVVLGGLFVLQLVSSCVPVISVLVHPWQPDIQLGTDSKFLTGILLPRNQWQQSGDGETAKTNMNQWSFFYFLQIQNDSKHDKIKTFCWPTAKAFLAQTMKALSCPLSSSPSPMDVKRLAPRASSLVSTERAKAQNCGYMREPRPNTQYLCSKRRPSITHLHAANYILSFMDSI